ncbi:MAG: CtsR family transcriptional regulator [Clostridia bacterium]|nr:CtsR family transcriptional regulator [Clostridia bacterium]MBQ7108698.1 CtsR family transcriptional regulator [Clostridia bacterium]MBQ9920465.1 CtsR family transcriptional regulator [Clostridia bacterium]
MKMSDIITAHILDMLEQSERNTAEIQRNEFASLIGCVPSQINYVLSSRFTPEHGYLIESRRGGGGYIRISRVKLDKSSALMHIINSVGSELDPASARILIENSAEAELISREAAELMQAAISNTVLREIPPPFRDSFRAAIVKQMLLAVI